MKHFDQGDLARRADPNDLPDHDAPDLGPQGRDAEEAEEGRSMAIFACVLLGLGSVAVAAIYAAVMWGMS